MTVVTKIPFYIFYFLFFFVLDPTTGCFFKQKKKKITIVSLTGIMELWNGILAIIRLQIKKKKVRIVPTKKTYSRWLLL